MVHLNDKDMRAIARDLERAGWTITAGKHVKCKSPCGRVMVVASRTPSDNRAAKNFRQDVERAKRKLAAMGRP